MAYILLCVFCYVFQLIFLFVEAKKLFKLSLVFKGLASLTFVALGILCMQKTQNKVFAGFIITGLFLDAIADVVFNIRFVIPQKEKASFLAGTAFFFLGHVMYLASLIPISVLPVIIFSLAVTVAVISVAVRLLPLKRLPPAYRVAGVIYFTTICLMVCIAAGNLIVTPASMNARIYFAGAVLFIASDIILSKNTFSKKKNYGLRVTNLFLYYTGQLLIAFSLLFI